MRTYYNEWEAYPAQWLRNLFPDADVDDRSICDVGLFDVLGYDRVHLFAGIGGWEYALQLAGWPNSVPVWTGSCPCQPFSVAGKKKGNADERHLWPEMYRLISKCLPPTIFGEQVAGPGGLAWFDGVRLDLERSNYAVGMAVLPAACYAPHKRERIYWVANSSKQRPQGWGISVNQQGTETIPTRECSIFTDTLADTTRTSRVWAIGRSDARVDTRGGSETGWRDSQPVLCLDGKWRRIPTEPSVLPLANGVPNRVGRIRAYGNSIVPQVAALFVRAYMDVKGIVPAPCIVH